jgi:hypothetical protein
LFVNLCKAGGVPRILRVWRFPHPRRFAGNLQSLRLIITVWRVSPAGESELEHIEIEYNRNLKPLEALLSRVRQPGDFFVSGTTEMPMPRIEVEGAGVLSFPVPDAQIAAVVRKAERAPVSLA